MKKTAGTAAKAKRRAHSTRGGVESTPILMTTKLKPQMTATRRARRQWASGIWKSGAHPRGKALKTVWSVSGGLAPQADDHLDPGHLHARRRLRQIADAHPRGRHVDQFALVLEEEVVMLGRVGVEISL